MDSKKERRIAHMFHESMVIALKGEREACGQTVTVCQMGSEHVDRRSLTK